MVHSDRCVRLYGNQNEFGDIITFWGFKHRCLGSGVFIQIEKDPDWSSDDDDKMASLSFDESL